MFTLPPPVFHTCILLPPVIVTLVLFIVVPSGTQMSNTPPATDDVTVNAVMPPTADGGRRSLFPFTSIVSPAATAKSIPSPMS